MRPVCFSINITLDGCYDHRAGIADEDLHRNATENLERADVMILGRNTFKLMEFWRPIAESGEAPAPWMVPFAKAIDAVKKYVVSNTLDSVEWTAEIVRGDDLLALVAKLKQESGKAIAVGGAKLGMSLAEKGLIDEYELVVHPRVFGQGPTLWSGLAKPLDLKLVSRAEFSSGAVAMRYEPTPARS